MDQTTLLHKLTGEQRLIQALSYQISFVSLPERERRLAEIRYFRSVVKSKLRVSTYEESP